MKNSALRRLAAFSLAACLALAGLPSVRPVSGARSLALAEAPATSTDLGPATSTDLGPVATSTDLGPATSTDLGPVTTPTDLDPVATPTDLGVTVPLDAANFPDSVLRARLSEVCDTDGDGRLTESERGALTALDLGGTRVSDLTGLALFPGLTTLDCDSARLKTLDLSGCEALVSVSVSGNGLEELVLGSSPVLERLNCSRNALSALDLSGCPRLRELDAGDNRLQALDLSSCLLLETLLCGNNRLYCLDAGVCPALSRLVCEGNTYEVKLAGQTALDLASLPGFDPARASAWQGAEVSGTVLTALAEQASYRYDCGGGHSAVFTLVLSPLAPAPAWSLSPAVPTADDYTAVLLDKTYDLVQAYIYRDGELMAGSDPAVWNSMNSTGYLRLEKGEYRYVISCRTGSVWTDPVQVRFTVKDGTSYPEPLISVFPTYPASAPAALGYHTVGAQENQIEVFSRKSGEKLYEMLWGPEDSGLSDYVFEVNTPERPLDPGSYRASITLRGEGHRTGVYSVNFTISEGLDPAPALTLSSASPMVGEDLYILLPEVCSKIQAWNYRDGLLNGSKNFWLGTDRIGPLRLEKGHYRFLVEALSDGTWTERAEISFTVSEEGVPELAADEAVTLYTGLDFDSAKPVHLAPDLFRVKCANSAELTDAFGDTAAWHVEQTLGEPLAFSWFVFYDGSECGVYGQLTDMPDAPMEAAFEVRCDWDGKTARTTVRAHFAQTALPEGLGGLPDKVETRIGRTVSFSPSILPAGWGLEGKTPDAFFQDAWEFADGDLDLTMLTSGDFEATLVVTVGSIVLVKPIAFHVAAADEWALVLPAGLTEIAPEAFQGISAPSVKVPQGCLTIGERAFAGSLVQDILVPASVTAIGEGALPEGTIIHAPAGSAAEAWAASHGYAFEKAAP